METRFTHSWAKRLLFRRFQQTLLEGSPCALALHICASASKTRKTARHGLFRVQGPVSSRQRAEEWQLPPFGANDSASKRRAAAGCSVRSKAANALGACARCRCRACDAREVCARMLGMCCAHPRIPRLPVLPQVSKMKPSALYRVHLHVQGGLACVLYEHCAWGACGRRGAAGKAEARRASRGLRTAVAAGGPRPAAQAGLAATHAACWPSPLAHMLS